MLNREQELKHIQSLPNVEKKYKKSEELVQKYPQYYKAYFELALLSTDLGKLEQARKYYEKAIELHTSFANTYNYRKSILKKGKLAVIREHVRKDTSSEKSTFISFKKSWLFKNNQILYNEIFPYLKYHE